MSTTKPRTILITGTSSGLGLAMTHHFAERGWNVVATLRDLSRASALPRSSSVAITRLDVEDLASIEEAFSAGVAAFGGVDVVVNNAGYGLFGLFETLSREAIQRQFDVNLWGVMDVTRAALPHFRARGGGTLINIASGAGVFGAPMASAYSASKFALEGFSEALSYELASVGVTVKLIEPGGAPETGFIARTARETGAPPPSEYGPFLEHIAGVYGAMATSSDRDAVSKIVAATYEAATDGTTRLRYQPTDDITPIVHARRSTTEERYQSLVRGFFALPSR